MTTIELKRIEIIRALTSDVNFLEDVYSMLPKKQLSHPCQYTVEELKNRIELGEEEVRAGHTISNEEAKILLGV